MASKLKITGVSEILQKITKADSDVEKVILNTLQKTTQPIKSDMLGYISSHRYSGLTESSWVEEFKNEKGKTFIRLGFSVRKGGLAAIFLNLGTPRMAPSFFIDNSIKKNTGAINASILKALEELFERS